MWFTTKIDGFLSFKHPARMLMYFFGFQNHFFGFQNLTLCTTKLRILVVLCLSYFTDNSNVNTLLYLVVTLQVTTPQLIFQLNYRNNQSIFFASVSVPLRSFLCILLCAWLGFKKSFPSICERVVESHPCDL